MIVECFIFQGLCEADQIHRSSWGDVPYGITGYKSSPCCKTTRISSTFSERLVVIGHRSPKRLRIGRNMKHMKLILQCLLLRRNYNVVKTMPCLPSVITIFIGAMVSIPMAGKPGIVWTSPCNIGILLRSPWNSHPPPCPCNGPPFNPSTLACQGQDLAGKNTMGCSPRKPGDLWW